MSSDKIIDLQTIVSRNEELIFSSLDEGTVMMSLENSEYYGLDSIGRRIWELMETPVKVSTICASLTGEYDVDPEQCRKDVIAFLEQLAEKDILKKVDA